MTLPVCRWRGDADAGLVTCRSPLVNSGGQMFPAQVCAGCYLADRSPGAVRPIPRRPPPAPRPPCAHEGAVLEWCHTCAGEFRHVRECDRHEKCTRGRVSLLVRACADCPDYCAG